MSVTVINLMPQASSLIKGKASLGLRKMADDVVKTARPNTPMKYGDLRNSVVRQVLGLHGTVQWTRNYAQFQERGYSSGPIRKYTTGGTGAHFAENAVKTVSSNPNRYFV